MAIETLATTVLALLTPYMAKTGESFASKAGEKLAEKVGALYQVIKSRFKGDSYAEHTLVRFETKPDSDGTRATLKELIEDKMETDSAFANLLRDLIEQAKDADTRNVIAYGERSVALGGDNAGNIITGDMDKP